MYQVLARKWRPRNFHELVGQSHVRQALTYALDNDRLHHAYLFTGTRGVGKTTIARIFAKSLNCLTNGVSSNPCGECAHCVEIEQGRFPDLIEVDAASRTGVDDTRELLDNVPYAPVKGRYKVYLIDEVHMFSKSSFNALLKTLEEPPAHVKFILATTDPQKLPATVLSRCLQFHLKNMNERQIVAHLQAVLDGEKVAYEDEAIRLVAQAANGSMRDALSLLDQAIAYGQGHIRVAEMANLLGAIPTTQLHHLLKALVLGDAKALRQHLYDIDEFAPDYGDILVRLLEQLQLITIAQLNAEKTLGEVGEFIRGLADALPVELVQLWYQIATDTWRNMPYQPDARMALEMGLLRMIALQPVMPTDKLSQIKVIPHADELILEENAPSISDIAQSLTSETSLTMATNNIAPQDDVQNVEQSFEQEKKLNEGQKQDQPQKNSATNEVNHTYSEIHNNAYDTKQASTQKVKTHENLTQDAVDNSVQHPQNSFEQQLTSQIDDYVLADIEYTASIPSNEDDQPPWIEPLGEAKAPSVSFASSSTIEYEDGGRLQQNSHDLIENVHEANETPAVSINVVNDDVERSLENTSSYAGQPVSDENLDAALNACIGQPDRWEALIKTLDFSGEALMLVDFSLPSAWHPPTLTLCCEEGNDAWVTPGRCQAVANTLSQHFNRECKVVVEKKATVETPYLRKMLKEEARTLKAKEDFLNHEQVKQIVAMLGATVDMNSIRILDESKESLC